MIQTSRLKLVPCGIAHFEALLRDDQELAALLGVRIDPDWLGFSAAKEAMAPGCEYLKAHPEADGWWTYLFIHSEDNTLIGLGGYKGPPDPDGMVEIGYSIAASYRLRGLATEAAAAMTAYAFAHPGVKRVDAHTLPEENASVAVLRKLGMTYVGLVTDPDDGEIWHWTLARNDYLKR